MTLPTSVVVSLGHYVGARPHATSGASGQIRLGPDVLDLAPAELLAWAGGKAEPTLLTRGLQADIEIAGGAVAFARTHRWAPLMLGLGPSVLEPYRYGIGLPGREILTVTAIAFNLWAGAAAQPTIWATCLSYVEARRSDRSAPPEETDPELVAEGLVGILPRFIAGNAVYVDIIPPGSEA